ncbi:rho GTPase-activating protein 17-like [Moschus berezovskii]|uniref:rho GTPase-activating protein 17-like n=1 Tax=Moschus berezovskii TaxID=68408 RepID=UPI002443AF08|nr:rho GTPase-activating protein 17-like [Moschus berezovskii]
MGTPGPAGPAPGVASPPKNPSCLTAFCPKKGRPPARRRRALGVGQAGRGSGTVKPAWSRLPAPDSRAPGQPHTWRCCCAQGQPPRALAGDLPAGETRKQRPGGAHPGTMEPQPEAEWAPTSPQTAAVAMSLKDACSWEGRL